MLADCGHSARPPCLDGPRTCGIEGAMKVQNFLLRFLKNGSGATSIEYALIACGIAVAIVVIIGKLSATVEAKYEQIDATLK
jgi:pilus assembly protein Flp/PilA